MQRFDSYQQNRRFHLAREAVVPFAVGLLLVASGIVCGFVIAAMTGSLATPSAAATPAVIEVAAVSRPACGAAAPATVGLASADAQADAPTFGFLVFEQDPAAGSTLPGFGPLPKPACVLLDPMDD
jgi:hypothetical protein